MVWTLKEASVWWALRQRDGDLDMEGGFVPRFEALLYSCTSEWVVRRYSNTIVDQVYDRGAGQLTVASSLRISEEHTRRWHVKHGVRHVRYRKIKSVKHVLCASSAVSYHNHSTSLAS